MNFLFINYGEVGKNLFINLYLFIVSSMKLVVFIVNWVIIFDKGVLSINI